MHMVKRILTDPITIIIGVIAGFVVGFYFKEFSQSLRPFADLYVALLSMCLLPILVTALVWGIGQILRSPRTNELFGRMALFYVVGLTVPCAVGLAVALIFQPGADLGNQSASVLGGQLASIDQSPESGGLLEFFGNVIPSNVFGALSQGQFISIVFFCALVGLALGVVHSKGADTTLSVINSLYQTFTLLFGWILVPLPLGLFAIVAASISEANPELLTALLTYVIYFYVAALIILVILIVAMSFAKRISPWRVFTDLKTPLILAFATDNAFVALYSAIESLQEKFGVDREIADTVVPFGVVANQHGQILLFVFTAIFLAQVYGIELSVSGLAIIAVGTIIAGVAAVGGGPLLAPIIAPVLLGAGVPDALALVILTTTQPAVARVASTLTVLATCALAVLSAAASSRKALKAEEDRTVIAATGVSGDR